MNIKNIAKLIVHTFPTTPSRSEIPDKRDVFGNLVWDVGDVHIVARKGTMGRIWAIAKSPMYPDECIEIAASNPKAAIRALIKYCHTLEG